MKPQQIEQTSKRYKGIIAVGVSLIAIGLAWWIFGIAAGNPGNSGDVMLVGILIYSAGRIGAWWNNG
jgi:hypothetical protein